MLLFCFLECGKELNDSAGEFSSPGYPSCVSPLQNCQWDIIVQPNHYLKVAISNLSIPVTDRCMYYFFKPQHGNFRSKRRICGTYSSISYIIRQSRTTFSFRTDRADHVNYSGFTVSYKQVPISELTPQELDTVYVNNIAIPYDVNNWLS